MVDIGQMLQVPDLTPPLILTPVHCTCYDEYITLILMWGVWVVRFKMLNLLTKYCFFLITECSQHK